MKTAVWHAEMMEKRPFEELLASYRLQPFTQAQRIDAETAVYEPSPGGLATAVKASQAVKS